MFAREGWLLGLEENGACGESMQEFVRPCRPYEVNCTNDVMDQFQPVRGVNEDETEGIFGEDAGFFWDLRGNKLNVYDEPVYVKLCRGLDVIAPTLNAGTVIVRASKYHPDAFFTGDRSTTPTMVTESARAHSNYVPRRF